MKRIDRQHIYRQGDGWVWSHDQDNRGLSYQEQLPYWAKTKAQVRQLIRERMESHDNKYIGICWA